MEKEKLGYYVKEESTKVLIIVNGFPRAGKDTFMDEYARLWRTADMITKKHSTVDTVKLLAGIMGWDGEKTPKSREMLSKLKDFYTEHFDGPLNEIKGTLLYTPTNMLFTAMREPDEIERAVDWCYQAGIKCETYLIRGAREEREHGSHSDAEVLKYDYDLHFENNGTEEEFKAEIQDYFNYRLKQEEV